jgi:hypothetical protein
LLSQVVVVNNVNNVNVDGNAENVENMDVNDVNVKKTTVRSIEAIVCELRREREVTELLSAREREVLDNFSELHFRVSQKGEMGENYEWGSSCPLFTKGKGLKLWKQEVEAWRICVETPEHKTRLAVDLAINLPHGHPLKI